MRERTSFCVIEALGFVNLRALRVLSRCPILEVLHHLKPMNMDFRLNHVNFVCFVWFMFSYFLLYSNFSLRRITIFFGLKLKVESNFVILGKK